MSSCHGAKTSCVQSEAPEHTTPAVNFLKQFKAVIDLGVIGDLFIGF